MRFDKSLAYTLKHKGSSLACIYFKKNL